MIQVDDLSRSLIAFEQISTLVIVVELSQSSWLAASVVETFVMHSTSVSVSREPRRAKTDRLDSEMLIRVFLGWLRGEPHHCKMVAIPPLSPNSRAVVRASS